MTQKPIRKSIPFLIAIFGLLASIAAFVLFGAFGLIFDINFSGVLEDLFSTAFIIGLFFLISTGAAVVGRRGFWMLIMILLFAVRVDCHIRCIGSNLVWSGHDMET